MKLTFYNLFIEKKGSAKSKALSFKSEQKSEKNTVEKRNSVSMQNVKTPVSFGKNSGTEKTITNPESGTVLHEDIQESEHEDEQEEDDEEDLELWFTDPQQLLDIFLELEEQNLSLIQKDQDKILNELNKKVEDVYTNCIGSNEANITTLQMLTNIENKLEDLFQKIEQMPAEKVEEAEKVNIYYKFNMIFIIWTLVSCVFLKYRVKITY